MANRRNAQPNQIVSSEYRQYLGIDVVLEERRNAFASHPMALASIRRVPRLSD